jgi:rare lipoprotein A
MKATCARLLRNPRLQRLWANTIVGRAFKGRAFSRAAFIAFAILFSISLTTCKSRPALPAAPGNLETGVASWYGDPFNGRPTASGEIFDMHKLTAAHRTLPLGTVVRVENISNHQKVDVKINDRGPFVAGRIIDLAWAAGQQISMPGIATVTLQVLSTPPTRAVPIFAVQAGNFTDRAPAAALREQMVQKYGTARIVFRGRDQSWRVLVGIYATEQSANAAASEINQQASPAFVVMVDDEN